MKVGIIGAAGTVGSATAYTIALRGLADELVLLDQRQNLLVSHAMDISTAAQSRCDIIVRQGQFADLEAADVVIVAAGRQPAAPLENVPVIKEIGLNVNRYCPETIVITATNPVDLLNYGMYLTRGNKREKCLGYCFNDTVRFRSAAAKVLGIPSSRVSGLVLGLHPDKQVMLFSSLRLDGKAVSLSDAAEQQVREETGEYLKRFSKLQARRTAGWTTAAGLAYLVQSISEDVQTVIPCSMSVTGEYALHDISIGLPSIIGRHGARQIAELDLLPRERWELEEAAEVLKTGSEQVRRLINPESC